MRQLLLTGIAMLLFVAPAIGQEQEIDSDARAQRVLDKTMEGFRDSLLDRANLKLDDMQRYLSLEDSALKRPRVYLKGVAKKESQAVEDVVRRYLGQIMKNNMNGESFSVNGKFYWHDPDETDPPEGKAAARIVADLTKSSLQISHNMGGSGFGLGKRSIEVEKMDCWKVALKQFSEEDLDRYKKFFKKRKDQVAIDAFVTLLELELVLSEEQSAKMREFVRPNVSGHHSGSLEEIARQFNSNRKIYENDPEFLSPAQLAKWKLMKVSPQTPNW